MGTAGDVTGPAGVRLLGALPSVTLPQAWHSPHRPTHFAVSQPHSPQRYDNRLRALDLLMSPTLGHRSDNHRPTVRDRCPQ